MCVFLSVEMTSTQSFKQLPLARPGTPCMPNTKACNLYAGVWFSWMEEKQRLWIPVQLLGVTTCWALTSAAVMWLGYSWEGAEESYPFPFGWRKMQLLGKQAGYYRYERDPSTAPPSTLGCVVALCGRRERWIRQGSPGCTRKFYVIFIRQNLIMMEKLFRTAQSTTHSPPSEHCRSILQHH